MILRCFSSSGLVPCGAASLLLCAATATWAFAAESTPPNFVVFLADDLGWGDLACYGHPRIQTPNLDKFATQGMRLTQCYSACSVCSPSRSAILTGRTPYRNGVWRWIPAGSQVHLRTSEITIAELLKERGYATCHVGKWHLNGLFNSSDQPQPNDHGYDHWFGTQNNAAPNHKDPNNFVRNGQPAGKLEGFSAQLVAQEAISWLQTREKKESPFFLTVWTHEPHEPIESAPEFMTPYQDIGDEGVRQHHGNVTQMDQAFGMVVQALDELKLAENTFVIFTSDNGPEGTGLTGRQRGSTGGLRGRKRHSHEGGIRVPGIVRWPGRVEPGAVSSEPVIGSDIFTTICEIAGIPLPSDRPIDGASMLPVFDGKPIARCEPLYWRNHLAPELYKVALRIGDWKIVGSDDLNQFELYNLREDENETADLAEIHPEKFAEMKTALIAQDAEVLAEGPDWWKDEPPAKKTAAKKKKS
jgi:arylsulfatase A